MSRHPLLFALTLQNEDTRPATLHHPLISRFAMRATFFGGRCAAACRSVNRLRILSHKLAVRIFLMTPHLSWRARGESVSAQFSQPGNIIAS